MVWPRLQRLLTSLLLPLASTCTLHTPNCNYFYRRILGRFPATGDCFHCFDILHLYHFPGTQDVFTVAEYLNTMAVHAHIVFSSNKDKSGGRQSQRGGVKELRDVFL